MGDWDSGSGVEGDYWRCFDDKGLDHVSWPLESQRGLQMVAEIKIGEFVKMWECHYSQTELTEVE